MNFTIGPNNLLHDLDSTRRRRHSIHHLLGLKLDDLWLNNHLLPSLRCLLLLGRLLVLCSSSSVLLLALLLSLVDHRNLQL